MKPVPATAATAREAAAAITNYRQRKILEMVYERGAVSAEDLVREFGVSRITIRRDLQALADARWVERMRGGAQRVPDQQLERCSRTRTAPPSARRQRSAATSPR